MEGVNYVAITITFTFTFTLSHPHNTKLLLKHQENNAATVPLSQAKLNYINHKRKLPQI